MEYENIKKLMDDMNSYKLTALDVELPDGTKISMRKEATKEFVRECASREEVNVAQEKSVTATVQSFAETTEKEQIFYFYVFLYSRSGRNVHGIYEAGNQPDDCVYGVPGSSAGA